MLGYDTYWEGGKPSPIETIRRRKMDDIIEYIKWNDPALYEIYMKQKEKNNG
jgi:hypothetical protein